MRVKAKINFLVFGTVFITMAAVAFATIRGVAQEAGYTSLLKHELAEVESARQMQVNFKKQVQAWKDILIRGSDPASLDKYTKEFFALENEVDKSASTLQISTPTVTFSGYYRNLRKHIRNWAKSTAPG